jgi:hypothetical protein
MLNWFVLCSLFLRLYCNQVSWEVCSAAAAAYAMRVPAPIRPKIAPGVYPFIVLQGRASVYPLPSRVCCCCQPHSARAMPAAKRMVSACVNLSPLRDSAAALLAFRVCHLRYCLAQASLNIEQRWPSWQAGCPCCWHEVVSVILPARSSRLYPRLPRLLTECVCAYH